MNTRITIQLIFLAVLCPILGVRADVIIDANSSALKAIRDRNTPPPLAARNLAILHTAIYDSVNGIKASHEDRFQPYLVEKHGPPKASQEAATLAAARLTLKMLWPLDQARFDSEYMAAIAAIPNGKSKTEGIQYGESVAQAILAARSNDGSAVVATYTVPPAPGIWRPTLSFGGIVRPALLAAWGNVTPFAVPSGSHFRPPAAPALHTPEYAAEVNEVKALGELGSMVRTPDETEIAAFWGYGPGSSTPPGHWNQIAVTVATAMGNSLDENARLFALLNIALADAGIIAWDCKYNYNYWRPITAIREANSAGNVAVIEDPTWTPYLPTPPFPEYTSGHSTFSAASAVVLAAFFGRDDIAFAAESDDLPGVLRHYDGFWHAAEESGYSRILGGIHFASGNIYGLASGAEVGEYVVNHKLTEKKVKKEKKPKK